MITEDDKKFYNENGFLLIKNILSLDEVAFLRKRAAQIFSSDEWKISEFNTNCSILNLHNYFPEFKQITLKKEVVDIMKALLDNDNIVITPESSLETGFYPTWHKDTTTQEKYGHTFHKRDDFKMIRGGFYLQDNNEFGGGLSVFAGSHKKPDNFLKEPPVKNLFKKVLDKYFPKSDEDNDFLNPYKLKLVDIPSKAGDLAVFNFHTAHRGTLPKTKKISDVPSHLAKISLFDTFGVNNEPTKMYTDFLKTRKEYVYGFMRNYTHNVEEFNNYLQSIGVKI